jgi:hypothetical protein
MSSSLIQRQLVTSRQKRVAEHLPLFSLDIVKIINDYDSFDETYSEYIYTEYKNNICHLAMANILLTKIESRALPDRSAPLKYNKKNGIPSELIVHTYRKEEGVANALVLFTDAERQHLFKSWEKRADEEESTGGEQCSKYRLLIAYYIATPYLEDKKNEYQMAKVRRYLTDKKIQQANNNNPLFMVIEIKYLVANGSHVVAFGKIQLLLANKYPLNLSGADLSSVSYQFSRINLSYTCLENVKFGRHFIFDDNNFLLGDLAIFPSSLEGSCLRGVTIHMHDSSEMIEKYPELVFNASNDTTTFYFRCLKILYAIGNIFTITFYTFSLSIISIGIFFAPHWIISVFLVFAFCFICLTEISENLKKNIESSQAIDNIILHEEANKNPTLKTHLILLKKFYLNKQLFPFEEFHLKSLTVEELKYQKNVINPQIKKSQLIKSFIYLLLAVVLIGIAAYLSLGLFLPTYISLYSSLGTAAGFPLGNAFFEFIPLTISIILYSAQTIHKELNNIASAYQAEKKIAAWLNLQLERMEPREEPDRPVQKPVIVSQPSLIAPVVTVKDRDEKLHTPGRLSLLAPTADDKPILGSMLPLVEQSQNSHGLR